MALKVGDKAPLFKAARDGGEILSLADYKGQTIVLYFYPKDDTSGCTAQACSFNENIKKLEKLGAQVIGISKDSVKSHDKFRDKYALKFPLVSDAETDICERYGVWVEKSMYGRKYMGIERTTFIINGAGKIVALFPKVKVPGHYEEVKAALAAM